MHGGLVERSPTRTELARSLGSGNLSSRSSASDSTSLARTETGAGRGTVGFSLPRMLGPLPLTAPASVSSVVVMCMQITRRSVLSGGAAAAAAAMVSQPRPGWAASPLAVGPGRRATAFVHADVVDVVAGRVLADRTVLVRGDRIVDVYGGPAPAPARVVDLRGRYLMPGLADMHSHAQAERIDPALNLAMGVTTVRDMAGSPLARDWRGRIEDGSLLGPSWVLGSRIVDGRPSIWDPAIVETIQVGTAAEARRAVHQVQHDGADFLKVYSRVSRPAYRALTDEAHRVGLLVAGHCPDDVSTVEAAERGQTSIEHLFWTPLDTSTRARQLRSRLRRRRLALGAYSGWFQTIHPFEVEAARTQDPGATARVYDTFARHGTHQVPTLAMHRGLDYARDWDVLGDDRNRYLPSWAVQAMEWARQEFYLKDRPTETDAAWARMFWHRLRTVADLHAAGAPIMTGTDCGTVAVYPGFSVHDELKLLVKAGLSNADALRAATTVPAAFLETASGQIAPRHRADMVVLAHNPLRDIRHTTSIRGVVVAGRYLDADARHDMLAEVRRIAAAS